MRACSSSFVSSVGGGEVTVTVDSEGGDVAVD